MSIEIRCTQCSQLLLVVDDAMGKQVKCPACGSVMLISAASGSDAFAAHNIPPTSQASSPGSISPQYYPSLAMAHEIQPAKIYLNDVFSLTWAILKKQYGMCLAAIVLVVVIDVIFSIGVQFSAKIVMEITRDRFLAGIFSLSGQIVSTVLSIWLGIGQAIVFLKIARGQQANIGDIFMGGPYLLRIIGGSIIMGLMVILGLILLIIPGIIVALMFSQFYYLIIDKQVTIGDAFSISKQVTTGNKLMLFFIHLLSIAIILVAAIPCGLGLFVAIPYFALMCAVIYLLMTGQQLSI